MNFFSHAAVARRFSEEPEFVFGAMLPDFASMLGVRLPGVSHPTLERGVGFHHLTDSVFHDLASFRALTRQAHGSLSALGLARGPARAVAHVGIEILLDMTLGQNAPARAAYLSGLEAGLAPELVRAVDWSAAERERLVDLLETLVQRGVVLDTSSAVVVERIRRTLARRPRLALGEGDPDHVLDWVESARDRVVASALAIVAELHEELARRQRA